MKSKEQRILMVKSTSYRKFLDLFTPQESHLELWDTMFKFTNLSNIFITTILCHFPIKVFQLSICVKSFTIINLP